MIIPKVTIIGECPKCKKWVPYRLNKGFVTHQNDEVGKTCYDSGSFKLGINAFKCVLNTEEEALKLAKFINKNVGKCFGDCSVSKRQDKDVGCYNCSQTWFVFAKALSEFYLKNKKLQKQ
jgi:hypothetical protein